MEEEIKGKKLLVLAGAAVHKKIVETAKSMGVYTIVTDYLDVKNSPAKQIADESWMLNITDVDGIVNKCIERNVDGVLSFCIDPAQKPYQMICEKLGVPCYCTHEQVDIMTNKNLFKQFCAKYDIDIIPEYKEINDEIKYPVLVKPSISRGSRGQTVCFNKEQMIKAVLTAQHESSNGNVIIEKYMQGKQDISLSYIVIDGTAYLLKIGDRYLGKKEDNLDKQCIATILPSRFTDLYINKIEPKVKNLISALGITFGPVFLQGFVDGETVRFYDPGLRFPGGDFDLILKSEMGFDTMKTLIYFALTGNKNKCFGKPENVFRLNNCIGIQLTLSARPGVVNYYEGFDEIAKLPYVISVSQRCQRGSCIPDSGDVRQRVVEILVYAPNKDSAKNTVEKIYSMMKVLDKNKQNMMVSLLDIEKLTKY